MGHSKEAGWGDLAQEERNPSPQRSQTTEGRGLGSPHIPLNPHFSGYRVAAAPKPFCRTVPRPGLKSKCAAREKTRNRVRVQQPFARERWPRDLETLVFLAITRCAHFLHGCLERNQQAAEQLINLWLISSSNLLS